MANQPEFPGRGNQMYIKGIVPDMIDADFIQNQLQNWTDGAGLAHRQRPSLRNFGLVLSANRSIEMQLQWRRPKPCQSVASWLRGVTSFAGPKVELLRSISTLMLNGSTTSNDPGTILARDRW